MTNDNLSNEIFERGSVLNILQQELVLKSFVYQQRYIFLCQVKQQGG